MSSDVVPPDDPELFSALEAAFGPGAADALDAPVADSSRTATGVVESLDTLIARIDAELQTAGPARSVASVATKTAKRRTGEIKHIVVQLDKSILAVPISHVVEVQRIPTITSIPHVPEWMCGVTNLRGEIISVVDGRIFFGMPATDHGLHRRLVIVQSLQQERTTGLIVDRVVGMRSLHSEEVKQTTAPTSSRIGGFLSGVVADDDRTLGVLNLEQFFACEEMSQFEMA